MNRRTLASSFLLLAAWLGSAPLAAQASRDTPLPVDSAVTVGVLDNGLRYYVRANDRPERRAELRLVLDAGSVLEEDDQRGLAHFVEHMAFNGTENFEKQALVDYLESIGMAFGPSVNAFTSFDETVYLLQVPTDDPDILRTAFLILEDWAHRISFDPVEVDQERGVVIEEWRQGRGASARISDEQLPVIFEGSRYAERLPIGDLDVLRTFPRSELLEFYETWYRPDLMAVIAVGDFDAGEVEHLIRSRFGGIHDSIRDPLAPLPPRAYYDVPDREETRYAIASDPEATGARVGLLRMQEPRDVRTLGDFRTSLVESLATSMLNARLDEITQQADPPFAFAGTSRGRFVRTESAYQLLAVVPEGGHELGLEALLTEAERASRHGFSETELEREKLDLLRGMQQRFDERDNQPSSRFASEYVAHFLQDRAIPSIGFEFEATRTLLPGITLDEVNAVARANLRDDNRIVLADGIERERSTLPTTDELDAVFARVEDAEIAPYEDTALDRPLIADLPSPGTIVDERSIDDIGVTVWELSNGATVWLKPTDFKEDEIVLAATSPGGWSRASLADHESATSAATLVQLGGVGPFSRIELQKALAGKAVALSPSIGETSEGLSGRASPRDVEALFQLLWLHFNEPRRDETAFQAFLSQNRTVLENRNASPAAAFADTFSVTMANGHPRVRPPSAEALAEIDLTRAIAFYRDRFADASDFTFVLVGALDLEAVKPLVERYVASLPSVERDDRWVDLDIDPPEGVVEKTVRRGIEPVSRTVIAFTGPFEYTATNRLGARAVAAALELRLRERLREDLGGTYSVSVNASYQRVPDPEYSFVIQFGSDPSRADELRAAVFDEIAALRSRGPSAEDVQKVVEAERRALETAREQNGWWAGQLVFAARSGTDPAALVDDRRLDAVTPGSIREDAERWLGEDRYVLVTLLPERPGS